MRRLRLIIVAVLALGIAGYWVTQVAQGSGMITAEAADLWNDPAPVLIPEKAIDAVTAHLGPVAFPNEEQRMAHAPQSAPSAAALERYVEWMAELIRPAWLPAGLPLHSIPLKAWADKRDALVTRYALKSHLVQTTFTRSALTVVVAPAGNTVATPVEGRAKLMRDTIAEVLVIRPAAKFTECSKGNLTFGRWDLTIKDSMRSRIMGVEAATDGHFVAMTALLCYGPATPRPPVIDAPLFDTPEPAKRITPRPPLGEVRSIQK